MLELLRIAESQIAKGNMKWRLGLSQGLRGTERMGLHDFNVVLRVTVRQLPQDWARITSLSMQASRSEDERCKAQGLGSWSSGSKI